MVFILALLAATLAGCPQKTAVWVAKDSTGDSLVFLIGSKAGEPARVRFYNLRVVGCEPEGRPRTRVLWAIGEGADSDSTNYPTEVQYGVVPHGFTVLAPVHELDPGCYFVETGGSGHAQFSVDSAGRVISSEP